MLHDTTDDQQKEGFGFVHESGTLLGQINGQKYCEFLAPKVMRDSYKTTQELIKRERIALADKRGEI